MGGSWKLIKNSSRPTSLTSAALQTGLNSIKSKQRVADHGEVFTTPEMVESMLDLVKHESERIDSRILEPACGSGNFLVPILRRKLATVHHRYSRSDFEKRHQALLGLMCIYGIELLADNVEECRANLLKMVAEYLQVKPGDDAYGAAARVLDINIVHGDALAMTTQEESARPITFAEWAYVGKGMYRRRDFRFDTLALMSSFSAGTLFGGVDRHDIFTPTRDYGLMSMTEIAQGAVNV